MKKMNGLASILILSATILSSIPAFARDSTHLVCAGYMKKTKYIDPDNYGISIIFDESRSGADTRSETLSTVFGREFYQGVKTDSNWGEKQDITIASKDDASKYFFKGQYQVISNTESSKSQIKLDGQIYFTPDQTGKAISTTLDCMNISN